LSKKANPTIVGSFILVAIGLTIAAFIALGNIKLKDDRFRGVAFFTGSLYGLDLGAPVTFRGVTIGRVSEIRINYDKKQNNYLIPVYVDIEQTPYLDSDQPGRWRSEAIRTVMQQLIDQGLRAQLKISSLLTGKLYIDLAFYPDTKANLHNKNPELIEIPTLPSGLEQITQRLEKLPLDEILNKTAITLDAINNLINSPQTLHALQTLDATLARLDTLLEKADVDLPALSTELKQGLNNFSTLAATATAFLQTADKELSPMSRDLQQLLTSLNTTAIAITQTLKNIKQLTAKDSNFTYQVSSSLEEIEKAAASARQLTEYLQQHPNALLFGQGEN
jgi:paraquat-inducible protein B